MNSSPFHIRHKKDNILREGKTRSIKRLLWGIFDSTDVLALFGVYARIIFHFPDPKFFQQLSNKVSVARTNQLPPPKINMTKETHHLEGVFPIEMGFFPMSGGGRFQVHFRRFCRSSQWWRMAKSQRSTLSRLSFFFAAKGLCGQTTRMVRYFFWQPKQWYKVGKQCKYFFATLYWWNTIWMKDWQGNCAWFFACPQQLLWKGLQPVRRQNSYTCPSEFIKRIQVPRLGPHRYSSLHGWVFQAGEKR